MAEQTWKIYWNEYVSETYLYGSKILMRSKSDVIFENQLIPPGTIIKTWYSKTHYQKKKIEPALPIIDGETEYELSADIEYPRGGSAILRLEFFDKYEEHAGFQLLRGKSTRFHCPLKTYSYQMQLMSGGAEMIRFHSVTLREVVDDHE